MNHFAAFWQSDGTPPDPETLRICGGELARPAGARLDAGSCHNLAYVVASWSFPPIDGRGTEAMASDDETVLLADARLDDRSSLAANLSRSLHCDVPLETSDAQMLLHAWRAWGEGLSDGLSATTHLSWPTPARDVFLLPGRIPAGARSSMRRVALGCSLRAAWTLSRDILRWRAARATRRYPPFWRSEIRAAEIPDARRCTPCEKVSSGGAVVLDRGEPEPGAASHLALGALPSSPDPSPDSREVPGQFFDLVKEATRDRLWARDASILLSGGMDSSMDCVLC